MGIQYDFGKSGEMNVLGTLFDSQCLWMTDAARLTVPSHPPTLQSGSPTETVKK